MKFLWNDKYFRICFYIFITALAVFTCGFIIFNFTGIMVAMGKSVAYIMSVFTPLIMAFIAVLFLNNIVKFYQKKLGVTVKDGFVKRTKATAATYISMAVVVLAVIIIAAVKFNAKNVEGMVNGINDSIQGFEDLFVVLKVKFAEMGILESVDGYIEEVVMHATESLKNGVTNMSENVSKIGGWLLNLAIGLTIAFYFLSDSERLLYYLKRITDMFFPKKIAAVLKTVFGDFTSTFSGYISGQVVDAIIMAVLISVSFTVIGIPYAIVIGIISGFSNLIPYLGALTAFALSVLMGLMSGNPAKALYAAIIVIILQQVDSLVIVPKVVGKRVELHPALVLLGLAVFGKMFGIWGMVFAVPLTAIIKSYLIKLYNYYDGKKTTKGLDK